MVNQLSKEIVNIIINLILVLSKHSFIDSATGLNFNFSDAGLFGFKVTGSAEKGADLLRLTLE